MLPILCYPIVPRVCGSVFGWVQVTLAVPEVVLAARRRVEVFLGGGPGSAIRSFWEWLANLGQQGKQVKPGYEHHCVCLAWIRLSGRLGFLNRLGVVTRLGVVDTTASISGGGAGARGGQLGDGPKVPVESPGA